MSRTCLGTGATSGIGEALAVRLAREGADVLGVARTRGSGDAALERIRARVPDGRVDMLVADLADLDQVRALADDVAGRRDRLDVLVLNAAVARAGPVPTRTGLEVHFLVNHLAGFLLTRLVEPMLRASAPARVITVGSAMHRRVPAIDWDRVATGPAPGDAYATSKLLTVLFTLELARRLDGSGVTANVADPGFVRTALGRDARGAFRLLLTLTRPFQRRPDRGADLLAHLALAPGATETTGRYVDDRGPQTPAPLATDPDAARRLWDLSTDLLASVPYAPRDHS